MLFLELMFILLYYLNYNCLKFRNKLDIKLNIWKDVKSVFDMYLI